MAFRRLALHLIHLILTNIVYICQFQFVITQKQKIVRVSSFDIMQVTNRATISNRHQHFIIWPTGSISRPKYSSKGHHPKIYPNHKNDVRFASWLFPLFKDTLLLYRLDH